MPELINGMKGIQDRINYPEMAVKANIQGRVYLQFIVNENGDVENPVVLRGIGGGCDEEAIRVIRETKFSPGLQRGRPVRVRYALPIIFMLR
jgi:protein TonB